MGSRAPTSLERVLWAIALVIWATVLYLSVLPGAAASSLSDRVLHAAAYAAVCGSLLLAAVWNPWSGWGRFPRGAWAVYGIVVIFGWAAEISQLYIAQRNADPVDGIANALGALAAFGAWFLVRTAVRQSVRKRRV